MTTKPKNYWDKSHAQEDPFLVPKRIHRGIAECARNHAGPAGSTGPIKYIWIYMNEDGLHGSSSDPKSHTDMSQEEWLNVVDESASLGAEWLIVHVGASLAGRTDIWAICDWAQQVHGLQVGIHVEDTSISDQDVERLAALDPSKTFLVIDGSLIESLRHLEDKGIRLCASNTLPEDRLASCSSPQSIACVGMDGSLFTCGLVLGKDHYRLGRIQEGSLREVMEDGSLPHQIPETKAFPDNSCDGCPPLVARHVLESISRASQPDAT